MADIKEYMQQVGQRARGAARHMARAETAAKNAALLAMAALIDERAAQLVEVNVTSGEADEIANIGFITSPNISPDGLYVAGDTGADGGLVIYNVVENQTQTLITPTLVSNFQWATFR